MARLSDKIEEFIKAMMVESEQNFLEIQRNELAYNFKCAPSQINYVLTTRFTIDRGYYIESRRGGGGCIKISWVDMDEHEYIKHVIWENIGEELTLNEAEGFIVLFQEKGIISEREAKLMKAVVNDKTLTVGEVYKNSFRAQLLKTMLITMMD